MSTNDGWVPCICGLAVLCDGKAKLARWREYYSDLLSRPVANPPDDLIETANSAVPDTSIDCEAPTESEVSKALGKLLQGFVASLANY